MTTIIEKEPSRARPRVTILDYGVGNLHSLAKALAAVGADVTIQPDPRAALETDLLVLPGVGAFSAASEHLVGSASLLRDAINDGLPTLGICLGMQILFDESDEGPGAGLKVFAGRVTRLASQRIPHMGWNTVEVVERRSHSGTLQEEMQHAGPIETYYAHGYACRPDDESVVTAWTTVGADRFPAIIRKGRIVGVQFHPEKSGLTGLRFLRGAVDAVSSSLGAGSVSSREPVRS